MESTKHQMLPFKDTMEVSGVFGKKVLTKGGKKIGKVKSVHINSKKLRIEGIVLERGFFDANQYIGANYIDSVTNDGVVLNILPVTEYVGFKVFDFTGKEIGKVKEVNRSKQTNMLLSILVNRSGKEDVIIRADNIAAVGENVVLKEAYPF